MVLTSENILLFFFLCYFFPVDLLKEGLQKTTSKLDRFKHDKIPAQKNPNSMYFFKGYSRAVVYVCTGEQCSKK